MAYAILTKNLCKSQGDESLIRDINIKVKQGEIYGLLGQENSGKTTVFSLISNLIKPSSGEIYVFEKNIMNLPYGELKKIGIITEESIFYDNLSIIENLKIYCEYTDQTYDISLDDILESVGLQNVRKRTVKNLDVREKQRLSIARAIISEPKLLILDEPFKGCMFKEIDDILELLKTINCKKGTTIFITTKNLTLVQGFADTIGIIVEGQLLEEVSMKKQKNIKRIGI